MNFYQLHSEIAKTSEFKRSGHEQECTRTNGILKLERKVSPIRDSREGKTRLNLFTSSIEAAGIIAQVNKAFGRDF